MPNYFIKTQDSTKGPFTLRVILKGIETSKIPLTAQLIEEGTGRELLAAELGGNTTATADTPSAPPPLTLVDPPPPHTLRWAVFPLATLAPLPPFGADGFKCEAHLQGCMTLKFCGNLLAECISSLFCLSSSALWWAR